MYSQDRPLAGLIASSMGLLGSVPLLPSVMPWATLQPLAVQDVATAILIALEKSDKKSAQEIYEISDILNLVK